MIKLVLYVTSSCHLCEEAQRIIHSVLGAFAAEIDIAEDESLMERYGVRIPVLHRTDTKAEISWPFNAKEVKILLDLQ